MRIGILAPVLAVLLAAGVLSTAWAQEGDRVESAGYARIVNDDLGRARDAALEDARRKAIESGVGAFVDTATEVEGFDVVMDRVTMKTQGYITRFNVLEEGRDGDNFRVRIEAWVKSKEAVAEILNDMESMCILQSRVDRPRVMALMSETVEGREVGFPTSESAIIKSLLDACFQVVDPSQVNAIRERDEARAAIRGDADAAVKIAMQFGANYIVTGEASVLSCTDDLDGDGVPDPLSSCRGRVVASFINTDSAQVLAREEVAESGLGFDFAAAGHKALTASAEKLAPKALKAVVKCWSGGCPLEVQLKIIGADFGQMMRIERGVREIRGVKNVIRDTFEAGGLSVLRIETEQRPGDFAMTLFETAFDGVELNITNQTGTTIESEVKQ